MLRFKNYDLGCQIATLVYDKFLIEAYGVKNCDINYKDGGLIEKILVKKIDDNGNDCRCFPKCNRADFYNTPLRLPDTIYPNDIIVIP